MICSLSFANQKLCDEWSNAELADFLFWKKFWNKKENSSEVLTCLKKDKTKSIVQSLSNEGRFTYPVYGEIIRAYLKNKNDGIDISAPEGTPVVAAETGKVAAITSITQNPSIIVLKHEGLLLTVYAGMKDIIVKEGEQVFRGQTIGKIGSGNPSFLHFEVRRGFESFDPMSFLK